MKKPIITIERAPEELIKALIEAEILEMTDEGLKVKEKDPAHRPK